MFSLRSPRLNWRVCQCFPRRAHRSEMFIESPLESAVRMECAPSPRGAACLVLRRMPFRRIPFLRRKPCLHWCLRRMSYLRRMPFERRQSHDGIKSFSRGCVRIEQHFLQGWNRSFCLWAKHEQGFECTIPPARPLQGATGMKLYEQRLHFPGQKASIYSHPLYQVRNCFGTNLSNRNISFGWSGWVDFAANQIHPLTQLLALIFRLPRPSGSPNQRNHKRSNGNHDQNQSFLPHLANIPCLGPTEATEVNKERESESLVTLVSFCSKSRSIWFRPSHLPSAFPFLRVLCVEVRPQCLEIRPPSAIRLLLEDECNSCFS